MLSEIPQRWKPFLEEIDRRLQETTEFHCIGGFVIAMLYNFERETSDLDFINVFPRDGNNELYDLAGEKSPLRIKYNVYLDPVTVANVPYNYEDRLTEMFPGVFEHLKLFALDPYDLALTKLERNMPRDQEDILHLPGS